MAWKAEVYQRMDLSGIRNKIQAVPQSEFLYVQGAQYSNMLGYNVFWAYPGIETNVTLLVGIWSTFLPVAGNRRDIAKLHIAQATTACELRMSNVCLLSILASAAPFHRSAHLASKTNIGTTGAFSTVEISILGRHPCPPTPPSLYGFLLTSGFVTSLPTYLRGHGF